MHYRKTVAKKCNKVRAVWIPLIEWEWKGKGMEWVDKGQVRSEVCAVRKGPQKVPTNERMEQEAKAIKIQTASFKIWCP